MRRVLVLIALLVTFGSFGFAYVGCGGGPPSAPCNAGGADGGTCIQGDTPNYTACIDLTTPVISYSADIQPIFTSSCSVGGGICHGDPLLIERTTGRVFLGYEEAGPGTVDAGGIISVLVGQKSPENTMMDIVAAGDPGASYMMHKLDQDQCQFAAICNATNNTIFASCGAGMPELNGILDQASRDKIRRWIAQGAKNN
jgi:hypothetical protein